MVLGEIIQKYRKETGLTMAEFAKKAGLSKGYISMLEKNINPGTGKPPIPSLSTIKSVAIATNQSLDELINQLNDVQIISIQKNNEYISKYPEIEKILDEMNEEGIQKVYDYAYDISIK